MIQEIVVQVLVGSSVLILGAYIIINAYYLSIHGLSLRELHEDLRERRSNPAFEDFESEFLPGIAVLMPAYNEAETVVNSVRSLLDIEYPNTTVIAINDGSTDHTLARLVDAFDLKLVHDTPPWELPSEPIRGVYRSTKVDNLLVIDKENGGKSDALNAGISLTNQPLFCSVDADSLIDRTGLRRVVSPFLTNPDETIAAGGTVRVANACEVSGGQIQSVKVSEQNLIGFQEIEYLRAFYSGRLGLSRLKSLLVISGTFGLFRTNLVEEIGGYATDTVTEDLDLVVRLHKHMRQLGESYRVDFVPEPIVWTQVPETLRDLSKQRRRWYRGMLEAFSNHREMVGNPRYGLLGTVVMPLFFLAEAIGPIIEALGYLLVSLAFVTGVLNLEFFLTFLMVIIAIGIFLSWFGVFSEVWSYRRYNKPRQVAILLGNAVLENFGYRQWKALVSVRALIEYFRNDTSWGRIERYRFTETTEDTAAVKPDD